jgi:phosphoglycolate phosphatase-like HAD superfamily hydrolase
LESALTGEFEVELRGHTPYAGRTDRAIIRDLFHQHGIAETDENLRRLLAGYLRRLPDSLRQHDGRVLPGIQALLLELRQAPNVAIGLLTGNVRDGARAKLGHFGLFEHFGFGGFGDHHFHRDDVAREALAAVHACVGPHCTADRVWVIGDTPLDVQCARAIGARVVAVATGLHSCDELAPTRPDLLLSDLSDPAPLLRLIL